MDNNNFFVKLLNFNMFDRVGKQIKRLATEIASTILALFMIASIACIVVPFFVIDDMHLGWFLLALLAALVVFGIGYLIAWFSGLFMYGFGELIDSASSINEKLGNGAQTPEASESAKPETAQLSPAKDIFASARNTTSNQVKRCPYCGDVVKLGRCEMCGKEVK